MNTQLLKPANFVGAEPVRQDITILPAQDSSKLRLGWVVFESEEEYQKYIKTKDGKKALKAYLQRNNPKRRKETDIVYQYRVYHHAEFIKPTSTGIRCVEVLQQFKGKLFNNELNNWLSTLRPSAVRVSGDMGVTLDSCPWRVTIYLEKDNKTIRKIEQEAVLGMYGHGEYKDISENEPTHLCFINEEAFKKIKVS